METGGYSQQLLSRAWQEMRAVWSPYRWWFSTSSALLAVGLLVARRGWGSLMNAGDVAINAGGGCALTFLGSWVISLIRSVKLLDDDRAAEIAKANERATDMERSLAKREESARGEIAALRDEVTRKHPHDERKEAMIAAGWGRLDERERAVVSYALDAGKIPFGYFQEIRLYPEDIAQKMGTPHLFTRESRRSANGLHEYERTYSVNPAFVTALRNVLYPL